MAYTKAPLIPALAQAFQRPTFEQNPLLGFQPNVPKASLYGRLFDRVTPQNDNSPYALEDEQKKRLFRQGLLQFGVAALQPNGGNTGAAIARGLLAGTQGLNEGARQYMSDAYTADKMRTGMMGDTPTDYREFDLLSKAGNLSAEDRAKAARIKLRLEGGAATGGYTFKTIKGADGKERIYRTDPRDPNPDTGVMVYDEGANGFVPVGGGAKVAPTYEDGTAAPTPSMGGLGGAPVALDPSLSPADRAAIIAMEGGQQPRGFQQGPGRAMPSLLVGRSAEEEAAAVQAAKAAVDLQYATPMADVDVRAAEAKARAALQAQLDFAPGLGRVEADIEGAKTAARTVAETQASAAKRARDSKEALTFLDDAEGLLKKATGGKVGALGDASARLFNYTTEGAKAASQLDILAAKLVANVPRFEGPQSNIDVQMYMQASGDLANRDKTTGERLSALQRMREIAKRYASQPSPTAPATGAPRRLKFNPATGKLE